MTSEPARPRLAVPIHRHAMAWASMVGGPGCGPGRSSRGTTAPGAPIPPIPGWLFNVLTGAALVWLAPRFLPSPTPWSIRFGIAITGFVFLPLIARLDS